MSDALSRPVGGVTRRRAFAAVAVAASGAVLATPAVAQSAKILRMVTSWPGGLSGLADSVRRVAQAIEVGSGGELKVEIYPAGQLVAPLAVQGAVGAGEAELYHSTEYYFQGKHRGFNFFSTVPLGLTMIEQIAWIERGGGQALWDELSALQNVKALACGGTGTQMGGWFVEPIQTIDDFRKTKIRMPGLGAQVLNKLGVETVVLPGGGIVAALKAGEIGATEWVGPWNDLQFGFQKLLSTYIYPGFHEPGTLASLGVNLDIWQGLTEPQRALIRTISRSENMLHSSHFFANNAFALRRLKREYEVLPTELPIDVFRKIAETAAEVVASVAEDDELAARIYNSFSAYQAAAEVDPTSAAEVAFLAERARLSSG